VSCENCREMERVDGVVPACRNEIASYPSGIRNDENAYKVIASGAKQSQKEGNGEITKNGCPIPALSKENQRLLEMRTALIRLKDLLDGKAVLEIYGAEREDLELLAELEDEMRNMGRKEAS